MRRCDVGATPEAVVRRGLLGQQAQDELAQPLSERRTALDRLSAHCVVRGGIQPPGGLDGPDRRPPRALVVGFEAVAREACRRERLGEGEVLELRIELGGGRVFV